MSHTLPHHFGGWTTDSEGKVVATCAGTGITAEQDPCQWHSQPAPSTHEGKFEVYAAWADHAKEEFK